MSEHEIIAADDRRFQAMVKQDWAALNSALADDLVYVHSSARVESKKEHVSTACPRCTWRTPARTSTSRSATLRCTRRSPTVGR